MAVRDWAMQVLHRVPGDEAAAEARHPRGQVQQRVPRVRARGLAFRRRAHLQLVLPLLITNQSNFPSLSVICKCFEFTDIGFADYGVDKYDIGEGFGHFGIGVDDVNTTSTPVPFSTPFIGQKKKMLQNFSRELGSNRWQRQLSSSEQRVAR